MPAMTSGGKTPFFSPERSFSSVWDAAACSSMLVAPIVSEFMIGSLGTDTGFLSPPWPRREDRRVAFCCQEPGSPSRRAAYSWESPASDRRRDRLSSRACLAASSRSARISWRACSRAAIRSSADLPSEATGAPWAASGATAGAGAGAGSRGASTGATGASWAPSGTAGACSWMTGAAADFWMIVSTSVSWANCFASLVLSAICALLTCR